MRCLGVALLDKGLFSPFAKTIPFSLFKSQNDLFYPLFKGKNDTFSPFFKAQTIPSPPFFKGGQGGIHTLK